MYLHQLEILARARTTAAELSRVSERRPGGRSSLRILLDARRAGQQSRAG